MQLRVCLQKCVSLVLSLRLTFLFLPICPLPALSLFSLYINVFFCPLLSRRQTTLSVTLTTVRTTVLTMTTTWTKALISSWEAYTTGRLHGIQHGQQAIDLVPSMKPLTWQGMCSLWTPCRVYQWHVAGLVCIVCMSLHVQRCKAHIQQAVFPRTLSQVRSKSIAVVVFAFLCRAGTS